MIKFKKITFLISFILIALIIFFPDQSKLGVTNGLFISTNIIIPALFPFIFCVFMIIKSGFYIKSVLLNKILNMIFGHNFYMFFTFLLSMIGGYPIGIKLINELYKQKVINNKIANIMLFYCVNAGPAFVISVAGSMYSSKKIGIILLISHMLSSIIISLLCAKKIKKQNYIGANYNFVTKNFFENFTESVSQASGTILAICGIVIVFSVINSYLDYFLSNVTIIKYITLFTEITSAVTKCKNIYFISFLLGFSSISIWFQIFSLSDKINVNKKTFILGRILHGVLSICICKILNKLFRINIAIYSNNIEFSNEFFVYNSSLFCSMLIMLIVLLAFFYSKNNSGKIINDVI